MNEWFWFFLNFCKLSENYPASSTIFFGKVVKTSFYVIIGTFKIEIFCWRRFIFSSFPDIEQLKFGLLAKSVWRSCKNAIYVCRRYLERSEKKRRNVSELSFFSINFWQGAKHFRPSGKNLSAALWKLHCTWSWEHFGEKIFFPKRVTSPSFSEIGRIFCGRRCQNCNLLVH